VNIIGTAPVVAAAEVLLLPVQQAHDLLMQPCFCHRSGRDQRATLHQQEQRFMSCITHLSHGPFLLELDHNSAKESGDVRLLRQLN